MGNHACPVEGHVSDLKLIRGRFVRHAARDGTIDTEERALLDDLDAARAAIERFHVRRKAMIHWLKCGEQTDYTDRLFENAGFGLVDLDRVREAKHATNIRYFPTHRNEAS